MINKSFRDLENWIFVRPGGNWPPREVPEDAVLLRIADQFDVHFVACVEDEEGEREDIIITHAQMKRWRIKQKRLTQTAGWNNCDVAIWTWPHVEDDIRLFRYPEPNEHWIGHIITPGGLLEHTDVSDPPSIMIPNPTTVLIAGLHDRQAQDLLLELSVKEVGSQGPLTRRPLVIDKKWENWNLVPDAENPLAAEYQKHFGDACPAD